MARGHVILSHGLESGPEATKVSALARVAEALGWTHERPDYRDLDARGRLGDVGARIERLHGRALAVKAPLVLAGWPPPLQAPAGLPLLVVHGWEDELIPARAVVEWCAPRRAELRLVDDRHRLEAHVDYSAGVFAELLRRVAP
ncbi:MAG: alpha/beta hydrolase [Caldimonas sp.]|nr:MAG: alpha/beta hydrolase [Caldimonas sp.]